uniref:HAT C-terminal dimerisation domain-containing protein n=1 Tax=Latimeria chalumnae TaxID=7897 RepID=H3A6Y0_LATCH
TTTVLIAKMIAKDMLPINFVEGERFQELVEYIEPEYTVLARKTIMARLEKLYTDDRLAIAEKVAITTDSWTTLNTESYVTIACHFIRQWKMESIILQTHAMPERHTTENLADMLNTAAETWNLKGKITTCVHDNASNIVLANTALLEWESNSCFAYTLQLAINDGFKVSSINRVVGAASRLVSHFHHSTVATQALKLKLQQQNLLQHRPLQYCKTRWNSINDMFERLQEQRWAIAAVLSDRSFTKLAGARTLELTDDSWQIIEELLPVLRSLKCATTALCDESEVSLSMVYPVTATLLSKHLKPVPEEFKTAVSESLRRRLEPAALCRAGKAALISSLLDPRHKHLKFIDAPVRMAVREKLDELNDDNIVGVGPHTSMLELEAANSTVKKLRTECDKHIAMATLFGDDYYTEKASVQTELENYILELCIPPDQDPLEWWKVNENCYRKLACLAKAYLCILTTSVPAERVFSAAGLIVNRLRSRLSLEHVDMLIFLNKNL